MKKAAFVFMSICVFSVPQLGCGSGEPTVVEAPEVVEEDPAMAGMTEEDYNKAMEESMK